ncbi:MAG: hypothetical protein J7K21_01080 [Desulfurococcales archaeon]|nr:hypothetical protein [Desulfurococcales archaeon]
MTKKSKKTTSTKTQEPEQAPESTPQLTPEQKEFLDAMNNLIMSAQELSYTVALLPNDLVEQHQELKELVESARNVVRATWRFHKLIKQRMRR